MTDDTFYDRLKDIPDPTTVYYLNVEVTGETVYEHEYYTQEDLEADFKNIDEAIESYKLESSLINSEE